MSEGYQFQVNVWQPSPDMGPVVERQMTLDKVVTLEPGWQAKQQPPQAEPNAKDGRQPVVLHLRNRRLPIEIAACWQHIGFAACYGEHKAKYDISQCRDIFYWLGLDQKKPTSHGTRRPACMVGAIAAYLARHANHRQSVQEWCAAYRRLCGTKGKGAPYTSVSGLYVRISQRGATEGKEKVRVFFNTFMALKAHCLGYEAGYKEFAFSDPPESVLALIDPIKAT